MKLKVAVLGASGIGKNHARWLHGHGCEVVAFLGSSPETLAKTEAALKAQFPFEGRGYSDPIALLDTEQPDAFIVSTPPEFHFVQVARCLTHDAHVLCEKPLVYDDLSPHALLNEKAAALLRAAQASKRILAVQTQYVALVPDLLQMCEVEASQVSDFVMEMDTKNANAGRGARELWVDLSPHPISVLLKLAGPNATLEDASLQLDETNARARLLIQRENGSEITARIRVGLNTTGPLERYFALNGKRVDVSGRNNAEGQYRIYLSDGSRESERRDLVDELIEQFVRACRGEGVPMATGKEGATNLEWCLAALESVPR